jgi:hypothetical protein
MGFIAKKPWIIDQQPDPADRLPACPLQLVIEGRTLIGNASLTFV